MESQLIKMAAEVRELAYAEYSQFKVGAALLCNDDSIFVGCNVENAVFGLSICAERVAMCKAISENHCEFKAIAIAASPLAPPCGTCRQFMSEFNSDLQIISFDANDPTIIEHWKLGEILPHQFKLK